MSGEGLCYVVAVAVLGIKMGGPQVQPGFAAGRGGRDMRSVIGGSVHEIGVGLKTVNHIAVLVQNFKIG